MTRKQRGMLIDATVIGLLATYLIWVLRGLAALAAIAVAYIIFVGACMTRLLDRTKLRRSSGGDRARCRGRVPETIPLCMLGGSVRHSPRRRNIHPLIVKTGHRGYSDTGGTNLAWLRLRP